LPRFQSAFYVDASTFITGRSLFRALNHVWCTFGTGTYEHVPSFFESWPGALDRNTIDAQGTRNHDYFCARARFLTSGLAQNPKPGFGS
jgi:hypothetical protein